MMTGHDGYATLAGAPTERNCAGLLVKPIRLQARLAEIEIARPV